VRFSVRLSRCVYVYTHGFEYDHLYHTYRGVVIMLECPVGTSDHKLAVCQVTAVGTCKTRSKPTRQRCQQQLLYLLYMPPKWDVNVESLDAVD